MDLPELDLIKVVYPDVHLNSPISLHHRDYINLVLRLLKLIEIDLKAHIEKVQGYLSTQTH